MPNFSSDFIYTGQPLDHRYICYAVRGHVLREEDKAYYWPQMKRIYDLILPLIKDWQVHRFHSDQALERMIGKPLADGTRCNTFRKAPLGGLQSLTRDRLQVATTKYLSDNAHLVARFDGKSDEPFFTKEHSECVYFFLHEIFAQRTRVRFAKGQVFQFLPHDLHITVGGYTHQYALQRSDPINQAIDMFVCREVVGAEVGDALARAIGNVAQAKHIWRAESGFMGPEYKDEKGYSRARYNVRELYEAAVDGKNSFGSSWVNMLK